MTGKGSIWTTLALLGAVFSMGCGSSSHHMNDPIDAGPNIPGSGGSSGVSAGGGRDGGNGVADAAAGTDAAAPPGGLAAKCSTTADCTTGLTCLKATDKVLNGLGGPSRGYCSLACAGPADTAACDKAGGSCVKFASDPATVGPDSFCMLKCTPGPGADTTMFPTKCLQRSDVACYMADPASPAVCMPACSDDTFCPTGRKCNLSLNICVDSARTGLPVGSPCTIDPVTKNDPCAGACLPINDGAGKPSSICSQGCVYGVLAGACGYVKETMSLPSDESHGVCMYSFGNTAFADLAFCAQQCDRVEDCRAGNTPNAFCNTTISVLGHGFCDWHQAAVNDGGADGKAADAK